MAYAWAASAPYDWTLLLTACERHELEAPALGPLIDPMLLDLPLC